MKSIKTRVYVKIGTDLSTVITADVEAPDGAEGDQHRYQMYDVLARTMEHVMDDRAAHRAWKSEVVAGNRAAARNVVVTPETDSLRERIAQGQLKIAHGKLAKIDSLLALVFDDYKPGESDPIPAVKQIADDSIRRRLSDGKLVNLYEEHVRPTLVEVHELDHERIEYDRAMSRSGEQGDETALPRMTHRRMHDALGLDHDHPYPNVFEYPDADGPADGPADGKPFAETGEQVITRHPDGTETVIDIVEVSPELQAAADAAAARAESELRPADTPTGPLPIPMPGPADEPTQEFKASDTITDPMPPVQVPPVDMDRAQEAAREAACEAAQRSEQEADGKPEPETGSKPDPKTETKRRPRR